MNAVTDDNRPQKARVMMRIARKMNPLSRALEQSSSKSVRSLTLAEGAGAKAEAEAARLKTQAAANFMVKVDEQ